MCNQAQAGFIIINGRGIWDGHTRAGRYTAIGGGSRPPFRGLSNGRYGYCRMTALLQAEGWWVNHKRVERICRHEGLKVTAIQLKQRRLWLGDGSCIRLRPTHRNHVWSDDFLGWALVSGAGVQGAAAASPPSRLMRFANTVASIDSAMNVTAPSPITADTPRGWNE